MNPSQIHTIYKSITRLLVDGQLKNAFDKIANLTDELQVGRYIDQRNELQQTYHYLLQYYVTGAEDPQRKTVYNKLIANLFTLVNELKEKLLTNNSSNYEYTTKRYFPHQNKRNIMELFQSLAYFHDQTALLSEVSAEHEEELNHLRSHYEAVLPVFFSFFWLRTTYNADDKTVVQRLLSSDYHGNFEKSLLISAITLNLWRMFDETKLLLLFDACQSSNEQVSQRASVGLCFILAKYNQFLPYFPGIRNRLVLLADETRIVENFQNIIVQIISTSETDKISKKMQDEILPEIVKLTPKLADKKDLENLISSEDWEEENPEWQKLLEQSGISDKLQELSELQLEGADIYMSTFSMLKTFPFFSELSNWFLPFDACHSQVSELFTAKEKNPLSPFMNSTIICNSDKYSFCLSILQMPEGQRNMVKQSFNGEAEQLEELSKDEAMLNPEKTRKNISKQYIQDLYRFFKLHTNRSDFSDMFATSLFMHRSYLFDILSASSDIKKNVAEYYFSKNLYEQALELFLELLKETEPSASLYQKTGYAYQKTSQIEKALDAYLKADIIQPDENWTIKKIALCYRMLGNFEKALEHYLHADFLHPNHTGIQIHIARCHVELGKYKEAFAIYHKLDAELRDNVKVWRAIVRSSFISGNLSQAEYYAEKLTEHTPSASDFLNAGHIAWCRHRLNDALTLYKKCWETQGRNWEVFIEQLTADKQHLISNGIDADEIPLLIDEIQYAIENTV